MRDIDADRLKEDLGKKENQNLTVEQLINRQPTITNWTPITDEPPKTEEDVILTLRNDGEQHRGIAEGQRYTAIGYWFQGDWWYVSEGLSFRCKKYQQAPIAYQRMPEPSRMPQESRRKPQKRHKS